MEDLVDMIEKILEKSNRIQQGFLDRLEENDDRLGRLEGRISSIQNLIEASARLSAGNNDSILRQIDGIADRQKLMSGLIENIEDKYPGFLQQIADDSGELHRFVNIYVNDEDIRFINGKDTPLNSGDVVAFLPALSGGL